MKSIYWYENDKQLFQAEVLAMRKFYPSFKLMKLPDGRLYWRGKVNPLGDTVWDLMVIYDNGHPHTQPGQYGGSIDVYTVSPNLSALQKQLGSTPIPHIYYKNGGEEAYICTVRPNEFQASGNRSSTAASCIAWACKWICVFELWLNGDIPFEEFDTNIHKF